MRDERTSAFVGTPIEMEVWLRQFFDSQRMFLQMAHADNDEESERCLELFERTVWKFEITPLDSVTKLRARDSISDYVEQVDFEREMMDLVINGVHMTDDDASDATIG